MTTATATTTTKKRTNDALDAVELTEARPVVELPTALHEARRTYAAATLDHQAAEAALIASFPDGATLTHSPHAAALRTCRELGEPVAEAELETSIALEAARVAWHQATQEHLAKWSEHVFAHEKWRTPDELVDAIEKAREIINGVARECSLRRQIITDLEAAANGQRPNFAAWDDPTGGLSFAQHSVRHNSSDISKLLDGLLVAVRAV